MLNKPLEFYLKWIASAIALFHVYLTAYDVYPYYKISGLTNAGMWIWLSIIWREPSLIILNTIMALIYVRGLFL
jgi:hypothetical protein